jgi:hypothetical protein
MATGKAGCPKQLLSGTCFGTRLGTNQGYFFTQMSLSPTNCFSPLGGLWQDQEGLKGKEREMPGICCNT